MISYNRIYHNSISDEKYKDKSDKKVPREFMAGNRLGFDVSNNLFEKIYRLNEIAYNNRKFYYHVSPQQFTKFERRNNFRKGEDTFGGVFLTPSLMMIDDYFNGYLIDKFKTQDIFYLYKCILSQQPNIFNPSNRNDRQLFLSEIRKNPSDFYENYSRRQYKTVMTDLQRELDAMFASHDWNYMENPEVTKIVKRLGYDGYVSKENNVGNLMIFDPEIIQIIPYNRDKFAKTLSAEKRRDRDVLAQIGTENFWTKQELDELQNRRKYNDDKSRNTSDNYSRRGSFNKDEFDDLSYVTEENLLSIIPKDQSKKYAIGHCFDEETGKLKKAQLDKILDRIDYEQENPPFVIQNKQFRSTNELEKFLIDKYGIISKDKPEDEEYKENWDDEGILF